MSRTFSVLFIICVVFVSLGEVRTNPEYLIRQWIDPEISENPNFLTVGRQLQLKEILSSYRKNFGGNSIPFEHFTDRIIADRSYSIDQGIVKKNVLRNCEAFPIIYAYLCGVLKRKDEVFVLVEGIELGKRDIPRKGYIPEDCKLGNKQPSNNCGLITSASTGRRRVACRPVTQTFNYII